MANIEHMKNIVATTVGPDAVTLAELRAAIRHLESGAEGFGRSVATLGHPQIDVALPWGGLPYGTLHEVRGSIGGAFAAALASRFLYRQGALVWCADARLAAAEGELYGPVLVRCRSRREVLWAAHEALRSRAVACVVAELEELDLLAGRRLQLAAEMGGAAGLILRFGRFDATPSAAASRWHVEPFFLDDGRRCWSLDLWRVKGGAPGHWLVRWNNATLSFTAAHQPADRPAAVEGAKARHGAA
jgi:protein ImuA